MDTASGSRRVTGWPENSSCPVWTRKGKKRFPALPRCGMTLSMCSSKLTGDFATAQVAIQGGATLLAVAANARAVGAERPWTCSAAPKNGGCDLRPWA